MLSMSGLMVEIIVAKPAAYSKEHNKDSTHEATITGFSANTVGRYQIQGFIHTMAKQVKCSLAELKNR